MALGNIMSEFFVFTYVREAPLKDCVYSKVAVGASVNLVAKRTKYAAVT
jgi:hypothetical protein